ncbi:MAG: hypothetical protein DWQ29_04820 [Planctomycetota bacterium]|nr:MAG: hypothetical protein DWQ29_04820 [Planctomycetota bacterium]
MTRIGVLVCLFAATTRPTCAQLRVVDDPPLTVGQDESLPVETAAPAETDPIAVSAQFVQKWQADDGVETLLLRGRCSVLQGDMTLTARQMVIWRSPPVQAGRTERLTVYMEGEARIAWPYRSDQQHSMFLKLETASGVSLPETSRQISGASDPLFLRAAARQQETHRTALQPTQYIVPAQSEGPLLTPTPGLQPIPLQRHVSVNPRYLGQRLTVDTSVSDSVPPELIITLTRGVNIVVDNVPVMVNGATVLTTIDLTADSSVIWTDAQRVDDFATGLNFNVDANTPLQVYLEGNIIVRQGLSEARATHAFYNVGERRGLLMNAEVRAFVPQLQSFLRVRAQQVRQLSESSLHARNAWVTTSQLGQPGFRLEASDIYLEERPRPDGPAFNPFTGQAEASDLWVTSLNNRLYIENTPVFYAPYLSAPAEDPQVPLRRLKFGYDGIFGLSVQSIWNLEGLFGLELPQGVDWNLQLDGFSERGPAVGTLVDYDFEAALIGAPAHHEGFGNLYYLHDGGRDNLGLGRRNLAVPDENRGRALWRHRTDVANGSWLTAELGFLSDRNFLEQYYERDWDTGKDYETLVGLNHQYDNLTISGLVRGRLNDFSNQTNWLPKLDLTILGEPLLNNWLTWSSHSSIGYGHIRPAEPPSDPSDPFTPIIDPNSGLPIFPNVNGTVAMTRHELNLPLNVGPVNIVPYVLGEAAHWQEDITGGELTRLYGSAGVKGSVMAWTVRPDIRNSILGLNGLAHKMIFDFDYYYANSDEPLSTIAQYNEFDDNAQERFRERFILLEYGGVLPAMFDPRFYAVRSGAGRNVTAPYHELVDDMQVLNLGWRHRWQTKVGPPARPRIKDWMTLDLEASFFPDADRDNFGEDFGLLGGRYNWYVGERTVLLADALYDVFNGGQELWSVGILSQRSTRGSIYLGFRQISVGPIDSQLIAASYSYAMSPKWVSTFGTSFDVAEGRDRGQSFTISRIGEYALLHFGFGYDHSRNNVGIGLSIEPRLGGYGPGSTQLSSLLGIQ